MGVRSCGSAHGVSGSWGFGIRDRGCLVRCFVFGFSPLLRALRSRDSWFGSGERVPFFACLLSAWIAELSWVSFSCAVGLGIVWLCCGDSGASLFNPSRFSSSSGCGKER
jgi:hypothetical protein